MATLMCGTGMRLMGCIRLRVKDIDFTTNQIMIRERKGDKDRSTMLPELVKAELGGHLSQVRQIHGRDIRGGYGRVKKPSALSRKYPNASGLTTGYLTELSARFYPEGMTGHWIYADS